MIILGLCGGWCATWNTRGRHKTYNKGWMERWENHHLFHSPSMDFFNPPFPPTSCVLNVIGSQFTKNNKLFKRLNNPVRKRYWKVFRIIRSSLLSVETDKRRRQWTQSCLRTKKVKHLLNYSVRVSCVFPENRRFLCWVDVITLPGLAPRACCHLCSSVCVVVV